MQKIVGIFIILYLLIWTIASSAKQYAPVFLDIPSAMIVFGITLGFMLATSGKGDWSVLGRFLSGAKAQSEKNPDGITAKQAQSLCLLLLGGSRVALISGFIGTLIGFIIMLMNMDDPSAMGPAMAVAIITCFYGAVLSELVLMMMYRMVVKRFWFECQSDQAKQAPPQANGNAVWIYGGSCLGILIAQMGFCFLSMMP